MHFEHPWYWPAAAILIVYAIWLSRRSYAQLVPAARYGSLALRCLILTCLIAALSRPVYLGTSQARQVVFALDVSRSISQDNLEAALTDIDRLAREAANRKALVSVIAFGRRPTLLIRNQSGWPGWPSDVRDKILYEPTLAKLTRQRTDQISQKKSGRDDQLAHLEKQIAALQQFRDEVAGDRTDIEQALRLATNCGTSDELRTVYLFTDGQTNRGRWQEAWSAAKSLGTLHAVKLDKPMPPEVALAAITLPPSVRINQGFDAQVRISSTVDTPARLVIFRDGVSVHEADIAVKTGDNTLKIPALYFREKGFHTIEAVIRPQKDTRLENNASRAMVVVPGEARVLFIDSDESQMSYLKSALELEGMSVEARTAAGIPQTLPELLSFDAMILSNVPADRLSFQQMRMIRTYVQEFGGGFLMLGGPESFGLGGYYNTPIEEILPVRMPIQKDINRPTLAIMLVIDKSGSMSGVKIELAKRAALATSEAINPRDLIGLTGFDSEAQVLMELTPAADRESIVQHVASLDAGGGTFLYPGLELARDRLAQINAKRKHVIVLSDGQTQGFGYDDFVQAMAADGITLSAIGIGEDADMKLMESIAASGGGRAYFTNDFYAIPQIFTREALRASNSMLVERLVQPAAVGTDVCMKDIATDELPLLSGYVATTPRPAATTILASDSGDPLLAKWRFGLGRTAAFTSEAKPHWAEDWIAWPDFAKFWSQLVRSVTGADLATTLSVECSHIPDGDGVRLTADLRDAAGNFATDAKVELSSIQDSGRTQALPVNQTGPGLFESRIPELTFGREQEFIWRASAAGKEHPPTPYGFAVSFSPEFQTLGVDTATFTRMADDHAGEVMSVGQSRLVMSEKAHSTRFALWPYLLALGLILAPFDILVRRVG